MYLCNQKPERKIDWEKHMATRKEPDKEQVVRDIAKLWEPLDHKQILLLRKNLEMKYFKGKQIIYEEKDSPSEVMCLVRGKVKVFKVGHLGRRQIIRIMKPMEFFGYRAPLAGEYYRTGAMALESCAIACIPLEILISIISKNFSVAKFFIQQLSHILGESEARSISLIQKHIRGRLADTLLYLMDHYGLDEDHAIDVCLSREDMASLSNMTTSNAIRTLSAFSSENLISTNGRKIKLLNIPELRNISEKG